MTTIQSSLGAFSVSLAVKDLEASRAFYEKLGFSPVAGDGTSYLIIRNGLTTLGLFQGQFERNLLTFNPGWDATCNTLPEFEDVRALQQRLRAAGLEPVTPTDAHASGPGHLMLVDPDGNPVLLDQHV